MVVKRINKEDKTSKIIIFCLKLNMPIVIYLYVYLIKFILIFYLEIYILFYLIIVH